MYDVWRLWQEINTQWRVSFGGLIGLDYTAVNIVAETLGINMTPRMLARIRYLENLELKRFNKKEA